MYAILKEESEVSPEDLLDLAKRGEEEFKELVEDLERLVHKMRVTYTEVTTSDIVKLDWAVKVLKEVSIYGRK